MIKAVLFDLGGTLVKTVEIPEIYRRILKNHGVEVNVNQIKKAHEANEGIINHISSQLEIGNQFWYNWNKKVIETIGITEKAEYYGKKITDTWWDIVDLELYPDVMETLHKLKSKKKKIGIVTNGFKYDYDIILKKLGIMDFFDIVVGPDSCGHGKPDKEIFLYTLDTLGLKANEVIYVGNEYKYDYVGAKKVGITPLLIKREQSTIEKTSSITDLLQIMDYV